MFKGRACKSELVYVDMAKRIISSDLRVVSVIVTYNNASMLKILLEDLLNQTRQPDEIIVIDNASSDPTEPMVRGLFPEIHYVRLIENTGSAGGYYEGIKLASENNDLVWTLDDDVGLRNDTLQNLLEGIESVESLGKVGALRSVGECHSGSIPTKMDAFAWRGTLIKVDAIKEVGLPIKEYFMYGEDLEYSLRLSKKGYSFFWIPGSIAIEKRAGKISGKLLTKEVIFYPDPFRLYYAFRNEIHMYLRYKSFIKATKVILYGAKVILYLIRNEGWKGLNKVIAIIRGILDGLVFKTGKNIKYLPEDR